MGIMHIPPKVADKTAETMKQTLAYSLLKFRIPEAITRLQSKHPKRKGRD